MKNSRIFKILIFTIIMLLLLTAGNFINVSPSARAYHQMTYDTESERVVLYGGTTGDFSDPTTHSYETWLFDPESNGWTQMSPPESPGGFTAGDMTYDSKADRSILSVFSDDWSTLQTWAYDANSDTWTRLADGPEVMVGQRIAYDSESDRIIMFGGYNLVDVVDATWVYDYNTNTWTNMKPRFHPKGRNYHGMVYDSKADRIVVWGGDFISADIPGVWTYDYNTNTWDKLKNNMNKGPAVRDYINLAYDSKADRIIMYGGYDYGNDETWVYDLNTDTWQQMQPKNNPGIISRYTMVYVRDVNRTILFGGQAGEAYYQYVGNTWSYNLKADRWSNVSPGQ